MRKNPELYDSARSASSAEDDEAERLRLAGFVRSEVLAPAGGWDQAHAAVNNGADAIYFGVQSSDEDGHGLNARARADNFREDELSELMAFLHSHGVKGYLTLNVLVFEGELAKAESIIRAAASAGVDALIVQDVGVAKMVQRVAPQLPLHASTQMSITSAQGVAFAASELGAKRAVLARELSWRDIEAVSKKVRGVAELEVFCHGALCVSYSGQCFSSEAWGGRSANRGQCAQGCRMDYGLIVGGELRHLGDIKYLLSPQDLMALDLVPQLMQAGTHCLKIEGRLKGAAYVALTVQAYRRAVDDAWRGVLSAREALGVTDAEVAAAHGTPSAAAPKRAVLSAAALSASDRARARERLGQTFARAQDEAFDGLSPGFLNGTAHQTVVRGRIPRHRGVLLGRVLSCGAAGGGLTAVEVSLEEGRSASAGDGVVFDCGDAEGEEPGGAVLRAEDAGAGAARLTFRGGGFDAARVRRGALVWRTRQAALDRHAAGIVRGDEDAFAPWEAAAGGAEGKPQRIAKSFARLELRGALGEPLRVRIVDALGRVGEGATATALAAAQKAPLTLDAVLKAVGQLGDSPLRVAEVDASQLRIDGGVFVPKGDIKRARRDALEELMALRTAHDRDGGVLDGSGVDAAGEETLARAAAAAADGAAGGGGGGGGEWSLLCRNIEQARAAMASPVLSEVVLDFLEAHGLKEACEEVRRSGKRLVVATPRVLKPGEERLWNFYLRLGADALLVRSAGMLQQLLSLGGEGADVGGHTVPRLHGDFSLNAANSIAFKLLLGSGLRRLSPTHDLSGAQILDLEERLARDGVGGRMEVVVHQHLPVFHTEHCVYARFLSDGDSYRDCGHPCETNTVHLRDGEGKDHLVLADAGCRNTVFNAEAQSAAPLLARLQEAGVRHFRLEVVDEPAWVVPELLERYRDLAEGEGDPHELLEWLATLPDANGRAQGVGLGSLADRKELRRGKMKETAYQRKRR